jgi:hypothetical protein
VLNKDGDGAWLKVAWLSDAIEQVADDSDGKVGI